MIRIQLIILRVKPSIQIVALVKGFLDYINSILQSSYTDISLYSQMVFVFWNCPDILTQTGPDLTSSVLSPKLNASTDNMESFQGLFESLYLAMSNLGSESSLYSSTFFLVSLLQNPISTIAFQLMKFILSLYIFYKTKIESVLHYKQPNHLAYSHTYYTETLSSNENLGKYKI